MITSRDTKRSPETSSLHSPYKYIETDVKGVGESYDVVEHV